jgi:hypothetical protein
VLAGLTLLLIRWGCSSVDLDEKESLGTAQEPLAFAGSLLREGDLATGLASKVAATALEQLKEGADGDLEGGWFITARTDGGDYTVESWGLSDDGSLDLADSAQMGSGVSKLAVTGLGLYRFVVASIDHGSLHLHTFGVDSGGSLQMLAGYFGEAVTDLAMTRLVTADRDGLRVVLALKRVDGTMKVVAFDVNPTTGALTPRGAATSGSVGLISIAAPLQPIGVVVTPVETSAGDVKLISWTANAAGDITRRNDVTIDTYVSSLSAVDVGYRRIAFAYNEIHDDATEQMWVRTYDVSASGVLTSLGGVGVSSSTRPKQHLALTNGGGGRLFLAGRDRYNDLQVRSYSVANKNNIYQVDANSAGAVNGVAALALKSSRLITPVVASDGTLLSIAWRDYNVPVAKSFWPEAFGTAQAVPAPADLIQTFAVSTGLSAQVDLTIAAGDSYVIAGAYNEVVFLDKAGNQLPEKHANVPTELLLEQLFHPLVAYTTATGAINYNNLDRYLEFQYACDPALALDSETNRCHDSWTDPSTYPARSAYNNFYDSSVRYDFSVKRFVIQTQLRFKRWGGDNTARYVLLAVSKTEDPRDGFYLYGNTESALRDMPQLGTAAGMAIVSWNGSAESSLRPAAFLYDLSDLASNTPYPKVTRITSAETNGDVSSLIPLNIIGVTPEPIGAIARHNSSSLEVFLFKKDFTPPVHLSTTVVPWTSAMWADYEVPHMPRASMQLSASSTPSLYAGALTGVGIEKASRKPMRNTILVGVNTSSRTPVLTYEPSFSFSEVYNCGPAAGYTCRQPMFAFDTQGRSVLFYGREKNVLDAQPSSWFGAWFRYEGGAETTFKLGEAQRGRGAEMDFVEGATDPDGNGVWAIYKYAAGSSYAVVVGRIMP